MNKTRGFTLIEILIVIFIVSIVTSVALMSMSQNENRRIESFTNELVQLVSLAEEQAMLQPSVLGLSLGQSSYYFASYHPPVENKKHSWVVLKDSLLGVHPIPDDLELNIEIMSQHKSKKNLDDKNKNTEAQNTNTENEKIKNIPQIIISTNGDITPFKIYVGKKGKAPRYVIKGDADGSIVSKMLS